MKFLSQFGLNPKGKILLTLLLLIIVIYIIVSMANMNNYNALYNADTLNVYSNNKLVTTVNNPRHILHTFNENIVGVYVTNTLDLGISRIRMSELYRLEFVKDGKTLSRIKVLTPRTQNAIDKIFKREAQDNWRELDGRYVIMKEGFEYFGFGPDFYRNLTETLKNNVK